MKKYICDNCMQDIDDLKNLYEIRITSNNGFLNLKKIAYIDLCSSCAAIVKLTEVEGDFKK